MDLLSVCFFQGDEDPAGSLKLSYGDLESITGIEITIWAQFGQTSPHFNIKLMVLIKY